MIEYLADTRRMNALKKSLICCIAAIGALTACQQRPYPIFFMGQDVSGFRGNTTKFVLNYQGKTYTKSPIITHEQIESYHSFMSMDDGSYGVVFTLKPLYFSHLYNATLGLRGALILPVVNGLAFQPVRVDEPIRDGRLVIWNGLNGYDLKQIANTIKPENPEMEKKRFKDKNPRPLPNLRSDDKNDRKDHPGRSIGEIISSGV